MTNEEESEQCAAKPAPDKNTQQPYSRKCAVLLLFLGWLAYTAGNVGRMNYAASMVAIIEETGAAKTAAGLVSSFFFFAYGAGQLVNGLLCHMYNSRLFIFGSLALAAVANFCMPFCPSVSAMKWLWLLNGMALCSRCCRAASSNCKPNT